MKLLCGRQSMISSTGSPGDIAQVEIKMRRDFGALIKEGIKYGVMPVKGTFSAMAIGQLECHDAIGYRVKCLVDAPLKSLLKARRDGYNKFPKGGRYRWVREMREMLAEGFVNGKVRQQLIKHHRLKRKDN